MEMFGKKLSKPTYFERLKWKLRDLKYYIGNRYFEKKHLIVLDKFKGQYLEACDAILEVNFKLLVDYVETDLAVHCFDSPKNLKEWLWYYLPYPLNYFFPLRCKNRGLQKLQWDKSVPAHNEVDESGNVVNYGCPNQAKVAREIEELYLWWTERRPARRDPMVESGLTDFYQYHRAEYGNVLNQGERTPEGHWRMYRAEEYMSAEDAEEYRNLQKSSWDIEERQDQEDEDMLIRLIKIRKNLWS